ncbi:MAG: AAC(3) family N-acetyltransferase [Anaerolineales bacterium]|uniref:AAC(3) family N-acetyltransferase n=1 Tax=Candidatus Villigracilis proximus TaxID=3140683 RepID=UPI003136A616|nr:AAC(3) family N-acetyltransferase [Anaerolineales bacterium]
MLNKKDLLAGFGKIKIESDTIVVHTSYKSLGGVEGGVDTVIDVMQELIGKDGTVLSLHLIFNRGRRRIILT